MNNLVKKIWNIRCKQELPAGDAPADGGCRRPKWVRCILWCLDRLVDVCFWLCLLVVAYVVLQLFVLTSFRIPSKSMIPTLVPGDRILVDKLSGGARLFNVFDALEKKDISIWRMPGWRDFQRGDVLVFNFPYPEKRDSMAFDVMLYYAKRCVGLPGDTLEIRNAHYRVRGVGETIGYVDGQDELQRVMDSGEAKRMRLVTRSYPKDSALGWNIAEFGPLYIPRQGDNLPMNRKHALLYKHPIEWEQKKKLRMKGDSVWISDSLINSYRFRESYYFMAGDKALNSRDSRYWGLLPETFIVGRVWRIWKSVDPVTGEMRWERIGKKVNE